MEKHQALREEQARLEEEQQLLREDQVREAAEARQVAERRRHHLQAELQSMRVAELRRRAKAAGVPQDDLDDADDADVPKAALIELVMRCDQLVLHDIRVRAS